MNRELSASFDKFALRKNMMPTDPRDYFFRREESRSSLHALLKSPSFIYAAFRGEKFERKAKSKVGLTNVLFRYREPFPLGAPPKDRTFSRSLDCAFEIVLPMNARGTSLYLGYRPKCLGNSSRFCGFEGGFGFLSAGNRMLSSKAE